MSIAIDTRTPKLRIIPLKPGPNALLDIHECLRKEILAAFKVPRSVIEGRNILPPSSYGRVPESG